MISGQTILPQALRHHHRTTRAQLHSVRTAHVAVVVAAGAVVVVAVELAETHSTALRP
jgi:hypothetical protein